MTVFFSHIYFNFSELEGKFTISTGPVIIHSDNKRILLHISTSTGKYQFIGWRFDDRYSFRENALIRAHEVIWENKIILSEMEPTVLFDSIIRDGQEEKILLIHYKASIYDEENINNVEWFTLEQIEELHQSWQVSSPNILICSKYFLTH
jgi:hypothetical protein